jgi:hypothetical protein
MKDYMTESTVVVMLLTQRYEPDPLKEQCLSGHGCGLSGNRPSIRSAMSFATAGPYTGIWVPWKPSGYATGGIFGDVNQLDTKNVEIDDANDSRHEPTCHSTHRSVYAQDFLLSIDNLAQSHLCVPVSIQRRASACYTYLDRIFR